MKTNKELIRFWDSLEDIYPKQISKFNKWLSNYKEKNEWHSLFNSGYTKCVRAWDGNGYDPCGETLKREFVEIPLAMQIGIWAEYSKQNTLPKGVRAFKAQVTSFMVHGR